MWWETSDGYYVNGEAAPSLRASNQGGFYVLEASGQTLKGTYATLAEAKEAARRLVQGFDPTTIS